jgi:hypothetical protein
MQRPFTLVSPAGHGPVTSQNPSAVLTIGAAQTTPPVTQRPSTRVSPGGHGFDGSCTQTPSGDIVVPALQAPAVDVQAPFTMTWPAGQVLADFGTQIPF